jgi:hypothetical protein
MARDPAKRQASQRAYGERRRAAAADARAAGNKAAERAIWGHRQAGDPTPARARAEVGAPPGPRAAAAGLRSPRSEGRELAHFFHYKATRGEGQKGAPTNRDMLNLLRQGAADGRSVELFTTKANGQGGMKPRTYDADELLDLLDDYGDSVWDFVDSDSEYGSGSATAAVYLVFAGGL